MVTGRRFRRHRAAQSDATVANSLYTRGSVLLRTMGYAFHTYPNPSVQTSNYCIDTQYCTEPQYWIDTQYCTYIQYGDTTGILTRERGQWLTSVNSAQ